MAAEDVQVRLCLQEIVKIDLEIRATIQDIQEFADCTETLEDLNSDVRGKVSKLKRKIEELETLGREQDLEDDRLIIQKNVETQRQRLNGTLLSLRKTNVAAQLQIDKYEKEELMHGGTTTRQRSGKGKEGIAKAASGVTESLVSLNRMMSEQVSRSQLTNSTLVNSSHTVTETREEMKGMGGHIKNSKNLLNKYGRRQLTDRLLIFLALVFFFGSVLYVVKKRIW